MCCLSDTISLSFSQSLDVLTHFLIKSFFTEKKKREREKNQQSLAIQLAEVMGLGSSGAHSGDEP